MPKSIALVSGGQHSAAALLLAGKDAVAVHVARDTQGAEGFHAARRQAMELGVSFQMVPAHHYGRGWLADMLRQAAGIAATAGVDNIYLGLWEDAGDARECLAAIQAQERERTGNPGLTFLAPLLGTPADLPFGMALSLEALPLLVHETHSCHRPRRDEHEWGHGCGDCPGCHRRREGWEAFVEAREAAALELVS